MDPHARLFRSPPDPEATLYSTEARDSSQRHRLFSPSLPSSPTPNTLSHTTLLWGNLEPWMDEEYAKQVCSLMDWHPVSIQVPKPVPDPATGQRPNNPGYCFLHFSTPAHAANVLAQVKIHDKGNLMTMPNSSNPFVLDWAPAVSSPLTVHVHSPSPSPQQRYQREYSIFVGDLAPETSNSDLVAVFRNPVLGQRHDSEPKFVKPFLSCNSAKIMVDPDTGISRGYGFVRFGLEEEQQRALFEMPGFCCRSRPMRISPATAKFKPPPSLPADLSHFFNLSSDGSYPKSVSTPLAAANSNSSLGSNSIQGSSSFGGSSSGGSLSSTTPSTVFSNSDPNNTARLSHLTAHSSLLNETQLSHANDGHFTNEAFWKHHSQIQAILGPSGEQLTSTDPYNTTVFVGGLSPWVCEQTLETFFSPFGPIYYVKVPKGKQCGFVQFVRKSDATRAIEKMQGFLIGGCHIRLSWGRSHCKAAHAAAAAFQAQYIHTRHTAPTPAGNSNTDAMTPQQALALLHKLRQQGYIPPGPTGLDGMTSDSINAASNIGDSAVTASRHLVASAESLASDVGGNKSRNDILQNGDIFGVSTPLNASANGAHMPSRPDVQRALLNFSPFSPNPNSLTLGDSTAGCKVSRDSLSASLSGRLERLPHPSQAYAPGFLPYQLRTSDLKFSVANDTPTSTTSAGTGKFSPSSRSPSTTSRYAAPYLDSIPIERDIDWVVNRPDPKSSSVPSTSGQLHALPTATASKNLAEADRDDLEDLKATLASLDLERNWPSSSSSEVNHYQQQQHQHNDSPSYNHRHPAAPKRMASSSPK